MKIVPEAFNLATVIGLWQPTHWQSNLAKQSYKIYTFLSFMQVIFLLVTQLIASLFYSKSVYEFTESSFMLISTINASVKAANLIIRRTYVLQLIDRLLKKDFLPQNDREMNLSLECHKMIRYITISCIILAEFAVLIIIIWPLIFPSGEFILPLRAWFPYDEKSDLGYKISYTHQTVAMMFVAAFDVANDILMAGLMAHTSLQLDFVILRLQELSWKSAIAVNANIPKNTTRVLEKRGISKCIQHHLAVFRFANEVNIVFAPVILAQFFASFVVLGITGYQLTEKTSTEDIINLLFYMIAMLVEFFLYCWFGNEVIFKSSKLNNAISEMDWSTLHIKTMKQLLIMMLRSTSPIMYSCGPLIQLSLDTFMKILKISYSAINILKSSS